MSAVMLAPELEDRLAALREAGWELFDKFDHEVRDRRCHPFVPANYESVLEALIAQRPSNGANRVIARRQSQRVDRTTGCVQRATGSCYEHQA